MYKRQILKGELKPGERLMELQLASKLGVSRTPVSYTHLDVYKRQAKYLLTPHIISIITKEVTHQPHGARPLFMLAFEEYI